MKFKKTLFYISLFIYFFLNLNQVFAEQLLFSEINETRSSPQFKKYITDALRVLNREKRQLTFYTLKSIADQKVYLDELSDLTFEDYKAVLHEFKKYHSPLPLTLNDYPSVSRKNSKAYHIITEQLDGYQIHNRIYLSLGQAPKKLASTLIHEVNHVLNRSDINYFSSPLHGFIEEFRAFFLEAVFLNKDPRQSEECVRIKKHVFENYPGFKSANISQVPCRPPGLLLPTEAAWKQMGW